MNDVNPQATPQPSRGVRAHVRGSSLLVGGRGLSLTMNLLVQIMTVRYLAKHDYGAFAYAMTMVEVASVLTVLAFDKALARYAAIYHEQENYPRLFGALVLAFCTICLTGLLVVGLVVTNRAMLVDLLHSEPFPIRLLALMIVLAPVNALDAVILSLYGVFSGAKAVFFRRHVMGPGLRVITVAAVIFCQGSATALAVGYVAAGIVGILIYGSLLFHILRRQGLFAAWRPRRLELPVKELFGYCFPLLASDAVFLLHTALVAFFLEYFHSATSVASFQAVRPFARLNELVIVNFSILFVPVLARAIARGDRKEVEDMYWQTVSWISVLAFPVFAVSYLAAEPITVLAFGERYADSGVLLAWLSLGFFMRSLLDTSLRMLKVLGRVKAALVVDVIAVMVALSGNLLLIPRYGALGGAIATCLTLIAYGGMGCIALWRVGGLNPFDARRGRVQLTAAGAALILVLVRYTIPLHPVAAFALAGVASVVVLLLCRNRLELADTFPELQKIPLVRRLVGRRP